MYGENINTMAIPIYRVLLYPVILYVDPYNMFIHYPLGAVPYTGSHYSSAKGPVYLNNVGCVGSESNLTECTRSHFGDVSTTCKAHLSYASVSCVAGEV